MHECHRRSRFAAAGRAALVLAALAAASCVYEQPVAIYQPGPSKFDRAWNAARAAADDVGVTVTDVDRSSGTIRGYPDATTDVTITVRQQADGSVRVAFNVRTPSGPDAALTDRLLHAYNRRMGR